MNTMDLDLMWNFLLEESKGIISDFRLGSVAEFVEYGEDILAIEQLIDSLYDERAVLTKHLYDRVISMAHHFNVIDRCGNLKDFITIIE